MNSILKNIKYVEWLSADEMHTDSKNWLSELYFINDELHFFEDLITSNTLQLLEKRKFGKSQKLIDQLLKLKGDNNLLLESLKAHERNLEIMVDGVDQLKEEKKYKDTHRAFINKIEDQLKNYKRLKKELFEVIKRILKKQKDTHLLGS